MLLNRVRKRKQTAAACQSGVRLKEAAAFAVRYRDVLSACILLQEAAAADPKQLARKYMSHVLQTQKEAVWWQENAAYLTQPWFIYEYACDHGLLQRVEHRAEAMPEHFVIEPEECRHAGCVRIHVERTVGSPSSGVITMTCEQADKSYHWLARTHRFQSKDGTYLRTTGEADGQVCDRAIETALALLRQGYRVCVEEALLRDKILHEDFEPAYPYWVLEGSAVDRLELRYPRDKRLHGYVYRAGGRWNGRTVEISICNAHLLDDLIRLYDFCITKGAKARMDAWQETLNQATTYRPRMRKELQDAQPPVDRFREMMTHKTELIDDLIDEDE